MRYRRPRTSPLLTLLLSGMILQACDSDGNQAPPVPTLQPLPPVAMFDITVTNTTNAQPLSPAAIVVHRDGYAIFSVGSSATTGLEELAEGGDNSALLAEAIADSNVVITASSAAPIGPAGSDTQTVTPLVGELPGLRLSVSTMLVNTNDAFSGVNGIDIGSMAIGDVISVSSIAYDAGTEANSEAASDIPGPAGGGEGFNSARDDRADLVSMHAGVVSQDDGFAGSDLSNQHRFDNPVMRVRIERTD